MAQNWQKPLISAHESEIETYLAEVRAHGDLDLWQEVASKLCDVLVVYRREVRRQVVKFTWEPADGLTEMVTEDRMRELTELAWNHAYAEAFSEDLNEN
jgi:hypothetical protein